MDVLVIMFACIAGGAIGWLLASRRVATAQAERDRFDERARAADQLRPLLDAVTSERDAARQEAAGLRAVADRVAALDIELVGLRTQKEALTAANAAYERGEAERAQAHAAQVAQLGDLEAKMDKRFGELAGKAVEGAHDLFLKRADARFKQSEETAGQGLKALLQPVTDRLQRYEDGVAKVEAERRDAFGNLTGLIESMRVGQEKVSSEAAKLVNSLRNAPKSRGRWGEQQLKNVLETCGLTENCDFQTEVSVDTEDGRLRPDVVIRIPGGRTLIIDAKVSLNAYQDAHGAVDEAERMIGMSSHASAMRAHVNTLGNKAYQNQFGSAPDYVIMFVPGEHFLSAALEHDPTLWDFAFDKKVLLATPTNLIAIARSVASVWQQEAVARNARAIADLGKELHDRLQKVASDYRKVGAGLNTAVSHYNAFVSSFESRVLVTGRKFRDLNIETGAREIEQLQPVEALARGGMMAQLAAPVLP